MNQSLNRLRAVMWKEWTELRRNRGALAPTLLLPIILTVAATVAVTTIAAHLEEIGNVLRGQGGAGNAPDPKDLLLQVGRQMVTLFLIMPCVLPSTTAAHSIVGEKLARSLEPVLATPVRTIELLGGKMLVCVLLGVIPAWISYFTFIGVLHARLPPAIFGQLVVPAQLVLVLLVGPLLALLSVAATTVISSRLTDVQAAQSVSVLVALPIIGVATSQAAGLVRLPLVGVFIAAGVLLCLDIGAVKLCVRLFDRETILTRWK